MDWEKYVEVDPQYFRPAEVHELVGDASRARAEIGWQSKTYFRDLVRIMVEADIELLERQLSPDINSFRASG